MFPSHGLINLANDLTSRWVRREGSLFSRLQTPVHPCRVGQEDTEVGAVLGSGGGLALTPPNNSLRKGALSSVYRPEISGAVSSLDCTTSWSPPPDDH